MFVILSYLLEIFIILETSCPEDGSLDNIFPEHRMPILAPLILYLVSHLVFLVIGLIYTYLMQRLNSQFWISLQTNNPTFKKPEIWLWISVKNCFGFLELIAVCFIINQFLCSINCFCIFGCLIDASIYLWLFFRRIIRCLLLYTCRSYIKVLNEKISRPWQIFWKIFIMDAFIFRIFFQFV